MSFGIAAVAVASYGAVAAGYIAATTVMYVGLAATVAGALTHDKTLSTIGTGMSLGGGVAGLAGAGTGAASTDAAAQGSTTIAPVNNDISAVNVDPGAPASSVNPYASAQTGVTTDAGLSAPTQSAVNNPGLLNTGPSASSLNTVGQLPPVASSGSPAFDAAATTPSGSSGTINLGNSSTLANGAANPANQAMVAQQAAGVIPPGQTDPSWFSQLDPTSKLVVGQAMAGAFGGLANMYTEQQKLSLQQLQNSQQWQQYQTQLSNANAVPAITFGATAQPGLLNSAVKTA